MGHNGIHRKGINMSAVTSEHRSDVGLRNVLSKRQLTMISIGGVIGAGLFVGSGNAIASAGPAIILSYSAVGIIVVAIMQMLGEMSTANPTSGSFSDYASRYMGSWAGFSVGWLYAYQWCVTIGFEAIAGAGLVNQLLPAVPTWLAALILLGAMIAVNLITVEAFGTFEYWFAMIKVATICVFLVIGVLVFLNLFPGTHSPGLTNLIGQGGFAPKGWGAVLNGSVVVFFSFFGTEVITVAAGEAQNPKESVRTGIKSVVWRILLFYIGSIAVIVTLMPWNSTKVMDSPYAAVPGHLGLPYVETIMKVIVLCAVLSCLNSGIYSASRMLHAMAATHKAPSVLSRTNKRGVPTFAVFGAASIGILTVIANYFLPTTDIYEFLIDSSGSVAVIVYLYISITHFRSHHDIVKNNPDIPVKMWGYPWVSAIIFVAMLAVIVGMATNASSQRSLLLTALVTIISIVIGFVNQKKLETASDKG